MRLNSALVSSSLFVSAVLADPREKQQPPFLDRAENSTDPTSVFPYDNDQWAGAVWQTRPMFNYIKAAAATFTVPDAYSTSGPKGFNIVVTIGGYDPRAPCGIGAGITVWANGTGGANYEAWGQWYPGDVQRAPDSFSIRPGHQIRVIVSEPSLKFGFVALMNITTKTVWWAWLYGNHSCVNFWDVDWIVTTIPSKDQVEVPNFDRVTFTDVSVSTPATPQVPAPHGLVFPLNITHVNQYMLSPTVYEGFVVVIEYIPDTYTVFPYDPDQWAGLVWKTDNSLGSIKSAAGTFTVPSAYSASSPKGFNIVVTIGGYDLRAPCGPGVGITVWANGTGGADYEAWGQWYPDDFQRAPDWFSIRPGHQIRAIVHMYNSKSALVLLMNLTTKKVWRTWVHGYLSCSHQWDADWVVTTIPSKDQVEVPNFGTVSFTDIDIILDTSGTPKVPDYTGQIITLNIVQDNRVMTSVMVYKAFVVITYIPDS